MGSNPAYPTDDARQLELAGVACGCLVERGAGWGEWRYLSIPPTLLLVPSGSRFETDLQAVRAARGLSLAQIQQETRIPVDVLRRFEEGNLIGDPTYNEVYLKAFLKSYAKAVGASPADVLKAYAAHRAGSYQGQLDPSYKGTSTPTTSEAAPREESSPASPLETTDLPDPVVAVRDTPPERPASPSATIAAQRVSRPAVPGAKRSYDKNWGLIIGLFIGAVVVLGSILWFMLRGPSGDTPDDESDAPGIVQIDSSAAPAGVAANGKRLQIPIRVTVTAGGNGLQNFRVTEAPNERLGHWIEPGESMTYESDSLVVLWGEGAEGMGTEATLEMQGERWTPAPGTVLRIDRESGQRLLDSLATAPRTPAEPASDGA